MWFLISVPRMRNSIAVSSFEHLRNGGKRPHSLISVSSSSSAGSNQSSNSSGAATQTNPGSLDVVHEDQRVPDITHRHPYQTGIYCVVSVSYYITSNISLFKKIYLNNDFNYIIPTETSVDMIDLNASLVSTASSTEDACTQTTLKRPLKQKTHSSVDGEIKQIDETHLQLPGDHIKTTDVS